MMRHLVRAAIANSPAMNMLTIAVLVLGAASLAVMRREVFPRFELEIVLVNVPYPGASPAEVEQGICQKIEEAVQSIDGIQKLYSMSAEGMGTVVLELRRTSRMCRKSSTRFVPRWSGSPAFRNWRKIRRCSRSRCAKRPFALP